MTKPTLYKDNSKSNNFFETMQTVMANRLAKPYGGNEPIVYEFTNDRAMLHQYYRLRETMYERIHHIDASEMGEDTFDKIGHVLIARRGRLCLGGCRLVVREADEMWPLPLETSDFKLRNIFPNLPLNKIRHGEISRFAVMEDTGQDENILYGLCKIMYEKVVDLKIQYLFAKSPKTLARNWRLIANSLGVKTARICDNIDVPGDSNTADMKFYIVMSDLSAQINPHLATIDTPALSIVSQQDERPNLSMVE